MLTGTIIAWAIVALCAASSFVFALAESAFFSIPRWRAAELAATQGPSGRRLEAVLAQPNDLLAAVVLGNTLSNTTLVAAFIWAASGWNFGRGTSGMAGVSD